MIDRPTMDTVLRRLSRVERENRRVKGAGVIVVIATVAAMMMGQATPGKTAKTIEAERFVLRDSSGRARAWLDTADGSVNLALADKDERSRAFVYVLPDGTPGLAFYDKDRMRRAGLAISTNGAPGLALSDREGKTRLELRVGETGLPDLNLIFRDGKRIGVFVRPDGTPVLGLVDQRMTLRAALAQEPDGSVRVILSDQNATERAELTVLSDGTPRLTLIGHAGRLIWHGP